MSTVTTSPLLAEVGKGTASRVPATGASDGAFAIQLLGVTSTPAPTISPVAPEADPHAAPTDGTTADAGVASGADVSAPAPDVRALGNQKPGTKPAAAPADDPDAAALLAMSGLAVQPPVVPIATPVTAPAPAAAAATSAVAAAAPPALPVGVTAVAPAVPGAVADSPAQVTAVSSTSAPSSGTAPASAQLDGATASVAAGQGQASATAAVAAAPATTSAAAASAPVGTSRPATSTDAGPVRVRVRTASPGVRPTGEPDAGAAAATVGMPIPVIPVDSGEAQTRHDPSSDDAPVASLGAAAPPVTPTAPAAAPPVAPSVQPQAFAAQIARPILTLRGADPGTHVLTIQVAPDSLGPVTVRAHLGGDGIHIELIAPSDQGRAALNAILPELKRDLAQGGMNSSLNVAPQSDANGQPTAGGQFGASQDSSTSGGFGGQSPRQEAWSPRTANQPATPHPSIRSAAAGGTSLLDVYA